VPKAMIGRLAVSERSEEVAGQVAHTSGECSLATTKPLIRDGSREVSRVAAYLMLTGSKWCSFSG